MFNDPKQNLASSYGIGFKLLKQMGFSQGEGIGKIKGISVPIIHGDVRPKQAGLGYFPSDMDKSKSLDTDANQKEKGKKTEPKRKNLRDNGERKKIASQLKLLGDARETMLLNENIHPPTSSSKEIIEIEERRLSLIKIERDIFAIQIPIYEALESFTNVLSTSVIKIQEAITSFDGNFINGNIGYLSSVVSIELELSLIDNVEAFFTMISDHNSSFSSILDDRVAGELRRAIKDSELKASSILTATNNLLLCCLLPLHKTGSLLDTKSHFPAIFTHNLLRVYLRVENSLLPYINSPSLSECVIYGLLFPSIKNYLRTNTINYPNHQNSAMFTPFLRTSENVIFWWLSILPEECCDVLVNSIILPYLKEVIDRSSLSDLSSLIESWLPYSSDASFVDCICHRLVLLPFETVDDVVSSLDLLRCFNNISLDSEEQFCNQLALFLSKKFVINAEEQKLEILEIIISVSDIFRLESLTKVLYKGLFPLLCSYASAWIKSGTISDLREYLSDDILQWYTGWKLLLPEELLQFPLVVSGFRSILDALNNGFDLKL